MQKVVGRYSLTRRISMTNEILSKAWSDGPVYGTGCARSCFINRPWS